MATTSKATPLAELVRLITTGERYHEPLCALAWRYSSDGQESRQGGAHAPRAHGGQHRATGQQVAVALQRDPAHRQHSTGEADARRYAVPRSRADREIYA